MFEHGVGIWQNIGVSEDRTKRVVRLEHMGCWNLGVSEHRGVGRQNIGVSVRLDHRGVGT